MKGARRQAAGNARRTPSLLLLALVLSTTWAPVALAEAHPRRLLAPTSLLGGLGGLGAGIGAAVLPVVTLNGQNGVTLTAVAGATAAAAIRAVLQNEGILAPIANVAGVIAGAAAVAQLSITPSGVSLVLCANVQAAVVAALKDLGISLPVAIKAGASVALNLNNLHVCNIPAQPPAIPPRAPPPPPPPVSPAPVITIKVNLTLDLALKLATDAILKELQVDGLPLPIAAVGAAAAGAAVVATLTLSPAGISLTVCAKILAAVIASLRALGFDPTHAAKAGAAVVIALAPLNGCIASPPPPPF